MAYNHEYPYVDPNRYNSDWILNKIKELEGEMTTFEALNKITFDGEWNISKQYPAWTIVNDNNGRDGYISIQPVPAGVTIDNADYWRSVANYSDLIADLQNRVIDLENEVAILKGRKFYLVGDSYGAGYSPDDVLQKGWCGYCKDMIEAAGGEVITTNYNGAGFATTNNDTWLDVIQASYSSITDPDSVTDFIILGGANDLAWNGVTSASLQSAIDNTIAWVRSHFVNAKIKIGCISAVYNLLLNDSAKPYANYRDGARKNGAIFLDDLRLLFCHPMYVSTDGTHLTAAGYSALSPYVFQCIVADHVDFNIMGMGSATLDGTNISSSYRDIKLQITITPNRCKIEFIDDQTNAPAVLQGIGANTKIANRAFDAIKISRNIPMVAAYSGIGECSINYRETDLSVEARGSARVLNGAYDVSTTTLMLFNPVSFTTWATTGNNFYVINACDYPLP